MKRYSVRWAAVARDDLDRHAFADAAQHDAARGVHVAHAGFDRGADLAAEQGIAPRQ